MKWKAPKPGDVRILTKFAILPITCNVVGENGITIGLNNFKKII